MVAANDQLMSDKLDDFVMVGELVLTGQLRRVKGVLPGGGGRRYRENYWLEKTAETVIFSL
jgi:predicted ATPase with chaperone activity